MPVGESRGAGRAPHRRRCRFRLNSRRLLDVEATLANETLCPLRPTVLMAQEMAARLGGGAVLLRAMSWGGQDDATRHQAGHRHGRSEEAGDMKPVRYPAIAAASIGQVHHARLRDGRDAMQLKKFPVDVAGRLDAPVGVDDQPLPGPLGAGAILSASSHSDAFRLLGHWRGTLKVPTPRKKCSRSERSPPYFALRGRHRSRYG